MSVTTKEWVLDTVEKLPPSEIEELRRYLEYLVWKSQLSTTRFEVPLESLKPPPTGQPTQVLAAINRSHEMSMEDAEALLQSIKEGEIPIRFDSNFDEPEGE